jgi:uncharacterized LabA/DUF88 family protein
MANSKVAVFIDLANISKGFDVVKRNKGLSPNARIDYEKLIPALTLGSHVTSKTIYTAEMFYTEEEKNKKYKAFLYYLKKIGFLVRTKKIKKILTQEGSINKANFDVEISIDATISIWRRDCNEIILISGDSDFDYLIETAREQDIKITIVSTLGTLSEELGANPDRLILLDDMDMNQFIFSRNIPTPLTLLAA